MKKIKIVGIAGSPRKGGNSEVLLDWVLDAAERSGAEVKKVRVADLNFSPCIECGGCEEEGVCVIDDDMQDIYPEFMAADRVVIATPMFFMNAPAILKGFIDRFQCMWAKKYRLNLPLRETSEKPVGVALAVGGTKGKTLFDGLNQMMKVFFAIIDVKFDMENSLYYRSVDYKGDMDKHETARADAEKLGKKLADTGE